MALANEGWRKEFAFLGKDVLFTAAEIALLVYVIDSADTRRTRTPEKPLYVGPTLINKRLDVANGCAMYELYAMGLSDACLGRVKPDCLRAFALALGISMAGPNYEDLPIWVVEWNVPSNLCRLSCWQPEEKELN